MGLAGGIVRRIFSKSPCSSAGGGRGHSEKGSSKHRRRWRSLRLYLCGEEMNAATEEEDDETVSVKSFETCVVMPPPEAHLVTVAQQSDVHSADDVDNPGEPEDRRVPDEHGHAGVVPTELVREEERAATLIQSAFRGFMARRQLQELRTRGEMEDGGAGDEPRSPVTSASVATSVVVQVGESLSNLRVSEDDSASVQQRGSQKSRPPPVFRVKEEWDDSTVSSNVSRMRMQSRIEATTRRERALAYAFSQQLRSCGGGTNNNKKRSARPEQAEFNVGWSWLERWMATRQAEPAADDCASRNADTGSAGAGRRVVVVRRRGGDVAVEEKESCGSNDVSVVSFDGSSSLGGRSGFSCHKPGGRSRLKGPRSLPRRKVASSDHGLQPRSHKVSKKGHRREEQAPAPPHKDQAEADGYDAASQPPTDY